MILNSSELPYVFDLCYDIKTFDCLKREMYSSRKKWLELRGLIESTGLKLPSDFPNRDYEDLLVILVGKSVLKDCIRIGFNWGFDLAKQWKQKNPENNSPPPFTTNGSECIIPQELNLIEDEISSFKIVAEYQAEFAYNYFFESEKKNG